MATEEPSEVHSDEKPQRQHLMSPYVRNLIVGTALAVILLTITAWAGSINTENAKRDTLRKDVAALAASFKYPLLEAERLLSDAGRERLQPMLVEIAAAGDYSAMVLTDESGKVLASTKGELAPTNIEEGALAKEPRVWDSATGLNAAAPIKLADTTLGYLFVETKL